MKSVGIVREFYNKWERRVPLSPSHVRELVKSGVQVYIQPCTSRIFSNQQYKEAGATLSEELQAADVILGVKQVPQQNLLPEKTYMFFSHTMKAQPENMSLLDAILKNNIQLIDYECIVDQNTSKRTIAFGGFAGRAGMLDTFRGVGERLLMQGYSTPFLNIGSAYMYADLHEAKNAVEKAGQLIEQQGLVSDKLAPMTFVFTGNGNVSKGAQEIFRLMPHEMVHPSELKDLPVNSNILYGCVVQDEYLVELKEEFRSQNSKGKFDRMDYYNNPEMYCGVFHEEILPHTSVLMNCMYWDDRFPRLITNDQMRDLFKKDKKKLIAVGDISCDIGGSVEFLSKTTNIENPFYLYNPITQQEDQISSDEDGVLMMGVDILPSELPVESSKHFGEHLLKYVKELTTSKSSSKTQLELENACIAKDGRLTSRFDYIHKMRAERERNVSQASMTDINSSNSTCFLLQGHLFDTGMINQSLNLIEEMGGRFYLVDCQVRPNNKDSTQSISTAIVQVSMESREEVDKLLTKITQLGEVIPGANASVREIADYCKNNYSKTDIKVRDEGETQADAFADVEQINTMDNKQILCLGAGLVVSPLLEYLSRDPNNSIHVVSGLPNEAESLATKLKRRNVTGSELDMAFSSSNGEKLKAKLVELISKANVVVSLLPATMHVDVAKICIDTSTPLVTASYVSPEMKKLHEQAEKAKIPILCELGLDPGMDHMSAMKVIDEVKAENGKITSFSSVCGGLPAPEAADNLLGYKFSWSPKGVLTAAQNASTYKENNQIIQVKGVDLLKRAEKVNFLPAFSLEQLPNRDCLPYADIYGIPDVPSIFRGTLRYAGCSDIMFQCRQLGLLNNECDGQKLPEKWSELMKSLGNNELQLRKETQIFLEWLDVYSDKNLIDPRSQTIMDAFCFLLQKKLAYLPGERDMALMHHEFGVEYANGKKGKITSTYVGYGSDDPKRTGDTIMAKTVGVTAAIGVQLILQDSVQHVGVLTPTTPDIYIPGLARLEAEGITFKEKFIDLDD